MLSEGALPSALGQPGYHCLGRCLPQRNLVVSASRTARMLINRREMLQTRAAHSAPQALGHVRPARGARDDRSICDTRIAPHPWQSVPATAPMRPRPSWRGMHRDLHGQRPRQVVAQASAAFGDRIDTGAGTGNTSSSTPSGQSSAPGMDPPSAGGEMPSQPEASTSGRPSESSPSHIIKMFHFVSITAIVLQPLAHPAFPPGPPVSQFPAHDHEVCIAPVLYRSVHINGQPPSHSRLGLNLILAEQFPSLQQVLFFLVLLAGLAFLAVLLYFTADIQWKRACIKVMRRLLKTVALRQVCSHPIEFNPSVEDRNSSV